MGHFTEFYGGERKALRGQIDADPAPDTARNRIGDVISRAGKNYPAGPSVKTSPTGSAISSSPRLALLRIPPCRRAFRMCNSASLIAPFNPSSSRSLK